MMLPPYTCRYCMILNWWRLSIFEQRLSISSRTVSWTNSNLHTSTTHLAHHVIFFTVDSAQDALTDMPPRSEEVGHCVCHFLHFLYYHTLLPFVYSRSWTQWPCTIRLLWTWCKIPPLVLRNCNSYCSKFPAHLVSTVHVDAALVHVHVHGICDKFYVYISIHIYLCTKLQRHLRICCCSTSSTSIMTWQQMCSLKTPTSHSNASPHTSMTSLMPRSPNRPLLMRCSIYTRDYKSHITQVLQGIPSNQNYMYLK